MLLFCFVLLFVFCLFCFLCFISGVCFFPCLLYYSIDKALQLPYRGFNFQQGLRTKNKSIDIDLYTQQISDIYRNKHS